MTGYEFIFSDKPVKRIYRHLLFWLVLILHFIIQNLIVGGANEAIKPRSFADSALNALFFFPVYILSAYIFMNILLPVYFFRRRYILFFFWLAGLIILDFVACSLCGVLYLHNVLHVPFSDITFNNNRYNAFVNGLFLPIAIFGITGGIKLAKNWYLEQKESERLAKEKITRELQLLKSQLHPRFLFHSLHTVKKHIRLYPLLAANLIMQLSDLLSYILYESDRQWVLLDKELEIIKSYIELQQKSRPGKLIEEINVSGVTSAKYISPLLLLSFIENIFDFFLHENQHSALKLYITVEDKRLDYALYFTWFSATPDPDVKEKFTNLEKQLLNIYPGTHHLEIVSDAEKITIMLSLPLYNSSTSSSENMAIQNEIHELL